MQVGARAATDDDLSAINHLNSLARAEKSQQRGGRLWELLDSPPHVEPLPSNFADHGQYLIVGTIDEVVVGISAVGLINPVDHEPIADLTAIFVEAEARGVGVGQAMMTLVIEWAIQEGCEGLDSTALPGDRHTKNFFESNAMVARSLKVHRTL